MEDPKHGAGWVWPLVAALSIVAAGGAIVWAATVSVQAARTQERLAELEQARAAAAKQLSEVRQALAESEARVRELENAPMERPTAPAPPEIEGDASSPEAQAFAERIEAMIEPGEDVEENSGGRRNPFREMFEGEQGDDVAEMSGNVRVTMFYKSFLDEAGLHSETKAQVRGLLRAYEIANVKLGIMPPEGMTQEEIAVRTEALAAGLRRDLAARLTPEQMTLFEQHDATKAQDFLQATLQGQSAMMAPDMSAETRELTVNTMVDELVSSGIDFSMPGSGLTRKGNEAQRQAILNAHERLAAVLPPAEMAEVDSLVRQFLAALKAQEMWAQEADERPAP